MGLKECVARDIERVFLNVDDFCDNLSIQIGTTKFNIIGSLQSNLVQNNSGNAQPLQENAWTLYVKYPLDDSPSIEGNSPSIEGNSVKTLLCAGTRLTIDGKSFTVVSVSDELGLATIQLNTRVGR